MANPKIFYANLLTAAMTASTTATGYAVANLVDWRSYTRWKPTAAPATLTMDCGSAQAADYGFVYAEAGTYQVRGSTDNFSASDVLLGTITLTATGPGLVVFASVSYRYYRITSTTGTPEVGIAAIGAALEMPVPLDAGFDPVGRRVMGQINRSVGGHSLGRVIDYEEWSEKLKFSWCTWSFYRNTFLTAWIGHLRSKPFGFCWDPASYPGEVRLVTAGDSLDIPHQPGSYCDIGFEVKAVH